jgi:hypothetical protein
VLLIAIWRPQKLERKERREKKGEKRKERKGKREKKGEKNGNTWDIISAFVDFKEAYD